MIDEFSKKEINKISSELLKQSKAFDIFPTPVDKIVKQSNLIVNENIDLSQINHSFYDRIKEKTRNTLLNGFKMVRGILDRDDKVIYLDLSQLPKRQNFVKLHEVGHEVLRWQNQVILSLDDDQTLNAEYDEQFEEEANYFASRTIFQQDRFNREMEKLELSIKAPMQLAKLFGSSIHASLRNYVSQSKNRCALLVLESIPGSKMNEAFCSKRNLFYSKSFLSEIGELSIPDKFGFKWAFAKDYKFRGKYHENGKLNFTTENDESIDVSYHFFNNGYNGFVFIFPKGETKKVKSKILP